MEHLAPVGVETAGTQFLDQPGSLQAVDCADCTGIAPAYSAANTTFFVDNFP